MNNEIRVGVVGVLRGLSFAQNAALSGMKLVAICDNWKEKLFSVDVGEEVARYTDYNEFLSNEMDAVILANYFHEHAPFAIKALKAGKHVMSETSCNFTLAEGVELCEAVEETGLIYMLAENYPYTKFNQELRRLYQSGEIGKVSYAEGEYNHPMSEEELRQIIPDSEHWRAKLPPEYYCTHALAPLVYITNLMPLTVVGFSVDLAEPTYPCPLGEKGFAALIKMEEGAVFRIMGVCMPGHSNWYRIHGTKGAAETARGPGYFGPGQVRVWHESWARSEKTPIERVYEPDWHSNAELAEKVGHGGGDYWVEYNFAKSIRTGIQPFLDVYRGVTMSSVGILIHRSIKSGGMPQEIPDFMDKAARERFRNDHQRGF